MWIIHIFERGLEVLEIAIAGINPTILWICKNAVAGLNVDEVCWEGRGHVQAPKDCWWIYIGCVSFRVEGIAIVRQPPPVI